MRHRFLIASAFAAVAGCASVLASGGPPISIQERAHGAARVVVATATTVTPVWRTNSYGDQLIVSLVGLQVEETLKGQPASFVSLDLEGGTIGDITLHVSSLPSLKPGERAVFFLDETGSGSHVPHLKGLGILKLETNNQVRGSSLRLDDIRRMAQGAGK
jgi:hypothetical protein